MKPFDLEAAKRGEPIVTRDGRQVKFVAYVPEAIEKHRLVVLAHDGNIWTFYEDGCFREDGCPTDIDLFMAPRIEKREGWINVYPRRVWDTLHDYKAIADSDAGTERIACIRVEYEVEV